MRIVRAAMIVACGAALLGCNGQISEQEYVKRRDAMRASPVAYQKEVNECVEKSGKTLTAKQIEILSALVNAPASRAVKVTCERLSKATRDGRVTYRQYASHFSGSPDPEIFRIMQGR